MNSWKRSPLSLILNPLAFASALPAIAADGATPQFHALPAPGETPWPVVGLMFPLVCLAMLVAMLFFMRRTGMGCMGRGRPMDRSGLRDSPGRPWSEPSARALEILNERFVRGEIDKREYEEKKAAIAPAAP